MSTSKNKDKDRDRDRDKEHPKGHIAMKTPPIVSEQEWAAARQELQIGRAHV